ncbi:hypothetical protein BY996DRAFT_6757224 [Phakopsora pachyrhizi]|uniref:EF-hand domain-containing protein n=1 Tax=Phakopsora pachyrhizi TaxID=170000 RepID=A0AAV0BBT4_PHAPC|nr:hypothetical protein BY996DRAFT_6757224 [Phakopsora pachyrhizi]CAH7683446.1 hypothetical protein PPACK8108_LOCUS16967 [Phakopsora pachyrhizi]
MVRSILRIFYWLVYLIVGFEAHSSNHEGSDSSSDYLTTHMDREHHIQGFDMASAFHLHDLNQDNILEADEVLKLYGLDHETAVDKSRSVEHHDSKASRVLSTVMEKLDLNKDGLITKKEFITAGSVNNGGLPKFDDIDGLGHHYDEEGEYFLHHEEIYHSTPETQDESSYNHPEDIQHFINHEKIEVKEDEMSRIAQGLPEDSNTAKFQKQNQKEHDLIEEREKRIKSIKAKAQKYSPAADEAKRRGDWDGFKRPLDQADRLRKNVPYKYKIRKSFWGEF